MSNANSALAINIDCLQSPYLAQNPLTQSNTCPVTDDIDFVYIMRRDAQHVARTLLKRMQASSAASAYNGFVDKLGALLGHSFSGYGHVVLHLYEPGFLEEAQLKQASTGITLSLDPLLNGPGITALGVSRHYYPGGTEEKHVGARPGFQPLDMQIAALTGRTALTVLEDDIFSGSSIKGLAAKLAANGCTIGTVIPGIQVGMPAALQNSGIKCQPVIQYVATGQRPLDGRVDLGDPRDFLLGADGLVVDYGGGGNLGRAPYILPFVSPAARLGIPKSDEVAFSEAVLRLNIAFYEGLQQQGTTITLADCDPTFQVTARHYGLGNDPHMPLLDMAKHCLHNLQAMQRQTARLHLVAKGHVNDQ